ncbi:hypothetical protein NM688_g4646 [Phlebia brevispora]|uniref:Uncharacterized protein n=1 Tax=Phlebia brevispora TaxID=194682 RepID=A0ACC1T2B9_9APHY|nr:hypothetical protein NM688_g4646 [Phlebia brevispora]
MSLTTLDKGKGKALLEKEVHEEVEQELASASSSASDSETDSDSDTSDDSESEDDIIQEQLKSLLEKARQNALSKAGSQMAQNDSQQEEEIIRLGDGEDSKELPLPPLDPGALPKPYIDLGDEKRGGPSKLRDLDVEQAEQTSAHAAPKPPAPSPSEQSGKTLTKKEKKAVGRIHLTRLRLSIDKDPKLKTQTAGKSWFDLPAPAEADLPRLYREVEALRLRNQLDPKRFYRKEEGEGKGVKGLPKYFAIGTIVTESSPFGSTSAANLPKSERKRTLVDELVDDAEAKSYAKKKFKELQTVRGARGRGTLARRQAARKPKW